jgi:heme-binding NEAT domain protein
VQVPTITPEVTNSPTVQDTTTTPDTSTNQGTNSPKTGDINISLVIVTTLISIFVILISAKRVKNKKKR